MMPQRAMHMSNADYPRCQVHITSIPVSQHTSNVQESMPASHHGPSHTVQTVVKRRASWPFQPRQKVSPAFRKFECFVMLTEAIWQKVRSAVNRVGRCAIFVTAHPRLRCMRTTFLNPRQCQQSLTDAVIFYS